MTVVHNHEEDYHRSVIIMPTDTLSGFLHSNDHSLLRCVAWAGIDMLWLIIGHEKIIIIIIAQGSCYNKANSPSLDNGLKNTKTCFI